MFCKPVCWIWWKTQVLADPHNSRAQLLSAEKPLGASNKCHTGSFIALNCETWHCELLIQKLFGAVLQLSEPLLQAIRCLKGAPLDEAIVSYKVKHCKVSFCCLHLNNSSLFQSYLLDEWMGCPDCASEPGRNGTSQTWVQTPAPSVPISQQVNIFSLLIIINIFSSNA